MKKSQREKKTKHPKHQIPPHTNSKIQKNHKHISFSFPASPKYKIFSLKSDQSKLSSGYFFLLRLVLFFFFPPHCYLIGMCYQNNNIEKKKILRAIRTCNFIASAFKTVCGENQWHLMSKMKWPKTCKASGKINAAFLKIILTW